MSKSKIYTKSGDLGETSLVSGTRRPKSDARIDLYGEIDELNSRVGYACALLAREKDFAPQLALLQQIQSALFDLGSNVACEAATRAQFKLPSMSPKLINQLEQQMDVMDAALPELKNFILPGGSHAAAAVHLCRTSTRTVERKLVAFAHTSGEELPEFALQFLNRLSDYFFVLARHLNYARSIPETQWKGSH
jgi:cob(I)alamin adenosyltransferase